MPYKTKYGTHYHETQFCCGASLPCSSTEGLSPCSICCKGAKDAGGSGAGVGVPAAGTPVPPAVGTYSVPDEGLPDDLRNSIEAAAGTPAENVLTKDGDAYTFVDAHGNKATFHPDGWVELEKGDGRAVEVISDEVVDEPAALLRASSHSLTCWRRRLSSCISWLSWRSPAISFWCRSLFACLNAFSLSTISASTASSSLAVRDILSTHSLNRSASSDIGQVPPNRLVSIHSVS